MESFGYYFRKHPLYNWQWWSRIQRAFLFHQHQFIFLRIEKSGVSILTLIGHVAQSTESQIKSLFWVASDSRPAGQLRCIGKAISLFKYIIKPLEIAVREKLKYLPSQSQITFPKQITNHYHLLQYLLFINFCSSSTVNFYNNSFRITKKK